MNKKHKLLLMFLLLLTCVVYTACKNNNRHLYGLYRYTSKDPVAMQMMTANNTYFQLYEGDSIAYHTEINGKKTFHHTGHFTVNNPLTEIIVKWNSGKVPSRIKLQQQENSYTLTVGSSDYVKE